VSGIRGVVNEDLSLREVYSLTSGFLSMTESSEVLLARDTRRTGEMIRRVVTGVLLSKGKKVLDLGVASTPALFRESRALQRPAIMITASHNEPEFNGLKFLNEGRGLSTEGFEKMMAAKPVATEFQPGRLKSATKARYDEDLVGLFGPRSCEDIRVAVDLGGGAGISHVERILGGLGCRIFTLNGSSGIFSRRVDPISDPLKLLQRIVKERKCEIGLGFDCDGDRLAIVDNRGVKRSGDYMLTLALSLVLPNQENRKVVVSVDTTQAVDEVVKRCGGEVFRSRVGEANVVGLMHAVGARYGGEGSSGGLIDGSFNFCRDSMLAAVTIIHAIRMSGTRVYGGVKSYHQSRRGVEMDRSKAQKAIRSLAKSVPDSDTTDGVKIVLTKDSWVLARPSGTENVVRVSAEAGTKHKADEIADRFSRRLLELGK